MNLMNIQIIITFNEYIIYLIYNNCIFVHIFYIHKVQVVC